MLSYFSVFSSVHVIGLLRATGSQHRSAALVPEGWARVAARGDAVLGDGGGGESDRQEGGGTGSGSLQTM